jgi:hypothetical protein
VDTEGRVARDWIEEYQDEDDVRSSGIDEFGGEPDVFYIRYCGSKPV